MNKQFEKLKKEVFDEIELYCKLNSVENCYDGYDIMAILKCHLPLINFIINSYRTIIKFNCIKIYYRTNNGSIKNKLSMVINMINCNLVIFKVHKNNAIELTVNEETTYEELKEFLLNGRI